MSDLLRIVADFDTQLAAPVSIGATTATLVSIQDDDSVNLPNGEYVFTIDNGNALKEYFKCTLTGVALTNVQSVNRQGVLTIGFARAHRRGAKVVVTDWYNLGELRSVLNGNSTLPNIITYTTTQTFSNQNSLINKAYADALAIAGAPNATPSVQGLVQMPTQAQVDAGTQTGSTGADLTVNPSNLRAKKYNDYVADTGAANAYVITPSPAITAYVVGQEFSFKATNANTTTSTLNVNALGVKTIKKNLNVDLVAGDILAGQIVKVMYDGTNFQMVSDIAPVTPIVRTLTTTSSDVGSSTTQFDITNTAGTTFRYTFDGTGTDPSFSLVNNPIGSLVNFQAQNFTATNNGVFTVTGAGANYVEVTNPLGVPENNKTIGTGYVTVSGTTPWTKPAGLRWITVKVQAGGGAGRGRTATNEAGPGGGGGGYTEKTIAASALASSVYYLIGSGGIGGNGNGGVGRYSAFGSSLYATPGEGGTSSSNYAGGDGGLGFGGDINIKGGGGNSGTFSTTAADTSAGTGGSSVLGGGARSISSSNTDGTNGGQYGGGGSGASFLSGSARNGGNGAQGVIIITEFY